MPYSGRIRLSRYLPESYIFRVVSLRRILGSPVSGRTPRPTYILSARLVKGRRQSSHRRTVRSSRVDHLVPTLPAISI